ncbi:MAG: hypothetical protein MK212_21610, partial [Saprospiraceae bacterium]|nr:hypothetical protein [Saprospiraceae bacterium]
MKFYYTILLSIVSTIALGQNCCDQRIVNPLEGYTKAPYITDVGNHQLKISTANDSAQVWFNQGLSYKHGYWDYEAFRAFREVVRLDSNCALGYLGLHWSLNHANNREFESAYYLQKSKELSVLHNIPKREWAYIRYFEKLSEVGKTKKLGKVRDSLITAFPNEIELKLIAAGDFLGAYNNGKPDKEAQFFLSTIKSVMKINPNLMAAHHYLIHHLEGDKPEDAIKSAELIGDLAINSSHIQHMPAHVYYELGDFEKARLSFEKALLTDTSYQKKYNVEATNNWNFAHNLGYYIINCGQQGRYRKGMELADLLNDVELSKGFGPGLFSIMMNSAAKVELSWRMEEWEDCILFCEKKLEGDT